MMEHSTDPEAIESAVRGFVGSNFLFGREAADLARDDSLIALGVLDSTGVLELVGFLENTWGIHVSDEELGPENLDSITAIVDYIRRKKAA